MCIALLQLTDSKKNNSIELTELGENMVWPFDFDHTWSSMLLKQGVTDTYMRVKEYLYGRKEQQTMALKGSCVGHVASQAKSLYFELGVTTSTQSKTEKGPTKTKVIYQCKVNNFHLNLTKNQYFITK